MPTSPNNPCDGVDDIEVAIVKHGLRFEYLHADVKTAYPRSPRERAVKMWLLKHPGVLWVALDDTKFSKDERLVRVDPDSGVTVAHMNEVLVRFGEKPRMFLI